MIYLLGETIENLTTSYLKAKIIKDEFNMCILWI